MGVRGTPTSPSSETSDCESGYLYHLDCNSAICLVAPTSPALPRVVVYVSLEDEVLFLFFLPSGMDNFVRLAPTDYASVTRALEAGAGGVAVRGSSGGGEHGRLGSGAARLGRLRAPLDSARLSSAQQRVAWRTRRGGRGVADARERGEARRRDTSFTIPPSAIYELLPIGSL